MTHTQTDHLGPVKGAYNYPQGGDGWQQMPSLNTPPQFYPGQLSPGQHYATARTTTTGNPVSIRRRTGTDPTPTP